MNLNWQQAPVKTQWGDEMVVASVAIDKDHTLDLYCERDQTTKVEAMFAQPDPVAWYVERQHIGFRDHGLKCGPFWKLSEAEEWTDCCHILKPLYATPPQRKHVLFPTMLRKMWSGGEVQAWLDENVNKEKNNG